MTIQAVFFDMGGTIETFWHTRELRLQATPELRKQLQEAGIDLHLNDEQLYGVVTTGLRRYHQWRQETLEEIPTQRIWREFVLAGYPIDFYVLDSITEDLMMTIETQFYCRTLRPEVPAVLEAIRGMGLKIGLISNVSSRGQVPMNLEKYGIRQYFDPVVLSSEYGRRKPDPAIFHYAARLANVPTSRCVYVGDRIARDIVGARKAGYRLAIQIRHDFEHGEQDEGASPDAVIQEMTELMGILRSEIDLPSNFTPSEGGTNPILRGLLFDAGDILYYRPQRSRKLIAFLNELSIFIEDTRTPVRNALADQAYRGLIDQEQYWEDLLRSFGVKQPEDIERGKRILKEEDNELEFFEGVPETLITLKNMGYLLGIVTDTSSSVSTKLSWFERGGFGHVWDTIISSRELGIRKPNPGIYQAALHQLGLSPAQAVFIGHSAIELEGARAVGIKTIAFNFDPAAKADDTIERFADLLSLPYLKPSEVERL
jgi:HAD superfamily hydrolase (TIGR01549 family)/HAD superfamily hydrolase (TIGR01509 family)